MHSTHCSNLVNTHKQTNQYSQFSNIHGAADEIYMMIENFILFSLSSMVAISSKKKSP